MLKKTVIGVGLLVVAGVAAWYFNFLPWGAQEKTPPLAASDIQEVLRQQDAVVRFLIRVREITDAAQLTSDETDALNVLVDMDTKPKEGMLEGIIAKTKRAVEELQSLETPSDVEEIRQLAIQHYETNVKLYEALQKKLAGEAPDADIEKLRSEAYDYGYRCDELRAKLHLQYNLGRL